MVAGSKTSSICRIQIKALVIWKEKDTTLAESIMCQEASQTSFKTGQTTEIQTLCHLNSITQAAKQVSKEKTTSREIMNIIRINTHKPFIILKATKTQDPATRTLTPLSLLTSPMEHKLTTQSRTNTKINQTTCLHYRETHTSKCQ